MGNILIVFGTIFFVAVIANSIIISLLYIFPAKQKSDLGGKRKIATVVSAVLFCLIVIMVGLFGYTLLIGIPSLWMIFLICLVGLIGGIYQGVKLHLLQGARVESYQLIEKFEKVRNSVNVLDNKEHRD
jgi:hypothetical protein